MEILNKKRVALFISLFLVCIQSNFAGPPFLTDDPAPVPYKHWEYYISSVNTYQSSTWSGTAPHFEANYGLIRNMQVHILLPVNYVHELHMSPKFGYADTELGVKYCFIHETDSHPQVGTFPILEVPTVKNDEFSDGKAKIFIPVWAQKSWDKLTTYGGAGYQINPGTGNKNSTFVGWEVQYDFSQVVTLGGELYFQSADATDSKSTTDFNIGGIINFSEQFHIIYSLGHSITNDTVFNSYFGLLWTI